METGEEQIKILAYKLYLIRCHHGIPGNDKTDWVDAIKHLEKLDKLERENRIGWAIS